MPKFRIFTNDISATQFSAYSQETAADARTALENATRKFGAIPRRTKFYAAAEKRTDLWPDPQVPPQTIRARNPDSCALKVFPDGRDAII